MTMPDPTPDDAVLSDARAREVLASVDRMPPTTSRTIFYPEETVIAAMIAFAKEATPPASDELENGKDELRRLMDSIWRAEFMKDAPNWKPFGDLPGMVSQIDNMYAGVRGQRDQARWDLHNPPASDSSASGAGEDLADALEALVDDVRNGWGDLHTLRHAEEAVAWLHTLHMEQEQTSQRLTFEDGNPWGVPGQDYSAEYPVTSQPLYAATPKVASEAGARMAAKMLGSDGILPPLPASEAAGLREAGVAAARDVRAAMHRSLRSGHQQAHMNYGPLTVCLDAIDAALTHPAPSGASGEGLTPRERIARVVAWEHYGIAWKHMEKASHADLLAMVDRMLATTPGADLLEQAARYREALTPSAATKAAYHGEFTFDVDEGVSDAGIDVHRKVYVPWDTVKQIMKAIQARALSPARDGAGS